MCVQGGSSKFLSKNMGSGQRIPGMLGRQGEEFFLSGSNTKVEGISDDKMKDKIGRGQRYRYVKNATENTKVPRSQFH